MLKVNYQDARFSPGENKRKYRQINNPDGTISFEDVTIYQQQGDMFSAADINATNEAINNRLPQTITSKSISSSSFSSISKQSWDNDYSYRFRAWVSHSGMTSRDIFLFGTMIINNSNIGVIESSTNGFWLYASERPTSTVVLTSVSYLKGA